MAAPWAMRAAISSAMLGASTQATEASTYAPMPHSRIGLRPKRSDSGPHTNCEMPKDSSSAANVICTCAIDAPRSCCKEGRAGR